MFSREFCEICKNTVLAEQLRTTASHYGSINSSEGSTDKLNCELWNKNESICINLSQKPKLLKREVQVKEQVLEAGVRRLQIRWSCKSNRKTSVLESISNKAAGLKVCNSIKIRLQHSCLPVKLAKFLKTPFFTKEYRWLLLTFNSCLHRSSAQKQVWLSVINTRFSWKKFLLPRKSRSSERS